MVERLDPDQSAHTIWQRCGGGERRKPFGCKFFRGFQGVVRNPMALQFEFEDLRDQVITKRCSHIIFIWLQFSCDDCV